MYLEKQEIKTPKFLPLQNKLRFLFENKKIEQFVFQVDNSLKLNETVSNQAKQISEHFKQILKKNQRAMDIIRSPKTGWKINKIDDKSQIAVKVTGTNVQLRYQGLLSVNIQNICIMIYQVNLFNNWVPFCTKGQDLAQISPLQKVCFLQFKMPFLTQRYSYFYGLGMDRIDHNGTIVIYGQGISYNQQLMKKFNIVPDKKVQKMVIMDLKFFIFEISYKNQNEYLFRSYCEIDSRMPILPEWLVNTIIKQMGGFIFDRVIKKSQNFKDSVWQKQIQQDKDNPFYPWLKKRINAWRQMKKKQIQNSKI